MKIKFSMCISTLLLSLLLSAGVPVALIAQTPQTGSLRGTVKDPSGAVIPGAEVQLRAPGVERQEITDSAGKFQFSGVAQGRYLVRATASGFTTDEKQDFEVGADSVCDFQLSIRTISQRVDVKEDVEKVNIQAESNSGAIVLKDKDLEALSDDPDELSEQLQAMAGPGAGPSGGQVFIDGFSGGQLPPKSSIREVRINSNPFSSEYDRPGFGRIEILTKPGTDSFHGQAFFQFNNQALNARSPLLTQTDVPPYQQMFYDFNLTGPVKKQKASFGLNFERRNIDEVALILATTLDPNLNPVQLNQTVSTPQVRTNITPRLDYTINANNTLTARYQYTNIGNDNQGVGSFNLPSTAYNQATTENTLQITETNIVSSRMVNETRFQYRRQTFEYSGAGTDPLIAVQGAFASGGATIGNSGNITNSYELSNMTSYIHGKHTWKWGLRARESLLDDTSVSNFNGTFSFFGGQGPQLDAANQAIPGTSESLTAIEVYQRTLLFQQAGIPPSQIREWGGGASLFSLTAGTPATSINQFDIGLYGNDDWKLLSNLTLSYGLRYETQSNISDYHDWSPRVGLAWGIDGHGNKAARTVLRAGFGIFYDRVPNSLTLQSIRYDGLTQQAYQISNPNFFPLLPSPALLGASSQPQQLQLKAPELVAPRIYQGSVGIERQINKYVRISANYIASRGVHLLRTWDINTPIDGVYPFGDEAVRLRTESTGFSRINQLFVNPTVNYRNFSMFGFYALSHGSDDNEGYPANPYNLRAEWGPATYADVRHRGVMGFNLPLPLKLSIAPFITMSSGVPYNITTGRDVYGNGILSTRPALVTGADAAACSGADLVYEPAFGCFNLNPPAGTPTIGRNYARGPAIVNVNLRLSRTWSFGTREGSTGAAGPGPHGGGFPGMMGGGGPRGGFGGPMGGFGGPAGRGKYNLTLTVFAMNAFNHPNYAPPSGDLASPYFGEYRSLAGNFGPMGGGTSVFNRRISFQLRFSF